MAPKDSVNIGSVSDKGFAIFSPELISFSTESKRVEQGCEDKYCSKETLLEGEREKYSIRLASDM